MVNPILRKVIDPYFCEKRSHKPKTIICASCYLDKERFVKMISQSGKNFFICSQKCLKNVLKGRVMVLVDDVLITLGDSPQMQG
jgi:hypothetical protein